MKRREEHPLATQSGVAYACALLVFMGGMCPKCGFGCRAISKKWSRCKRCGERVARRALPPLRDSNQPSKP